MGVTLSQRMVKRLTKMDNKELLELKAKMKKKLPWFTRQDCHKKKRLAPKWRRPKGVHSKMRHQFRSRKKIVKVGYGTPKILRDVNRKGFKEIVVNNLTDLSKIDIKSECAAIAKSVGLKKKVEIVKKALEKNIVIINVKDSSAFIKRVEDSLSKNKEDKRKKDKVKEDKKKELEKKAEDIKKKEDKKESEELDDKLKKEDDKKEKDKLLIKKE